MNVNPPLPPPLPPKQHPINVNVSVNPPSPPLPPTPQPPKLPPRLQQTPELPGIILSETPRQEVITSEGKDINLEDEIGASVSIPRDATIRSAEIDLATSFSGQFQLPEGVESVSPAYMIKTSNDVEFSKDVDVRLRHTANIQTAEDCNSMVFLRADITPTRSSDSRIVYKFEEIKGKSAEFGTGRRRFGVIKLKRLFSWFKIGKRQEGSK
jgi:hypothetical protein